ncbi:MAG: hypothetical protein PGN13_07255 [Patulibacter minatonensis]
MFDHLSTRASDRAATEAFYDAVLPPLGVLGPAPRQALHALRRLRAVGLAGERWTTGHPRHAPRAARPEPRGRVDAFWQAGIAAGHPERRRAGRAVRTPLATTAPSCATPTATRSRACLHERLRPRGLIDHAWLGAADLAGQRTFLALLAEHAELEIVADEPDLVRVRGRRGGSLTLTTRPVGTDGAARAATVGLHLAIPAPRATIDAWHAAAVAAGHTDDGAPGPRGYHPGYYGAFVLDPAGLSYELVDHDGVLGERW